MRADPHHLTSVAAAIRERRHSRQADRLNSEDAAYAGPRLSYRGTRVSAVAC
jgi:hypothetical protein